MRAMCQSYITCNSSREQLLWDAQQDDSICTVHDVRSMIVVPVLQDRTESRDAIDTSDCTNTDTKAVQGVKNMPRACSTCT